MRAIDGDALEDRLRSLAYDDWNHGVTTSWANAYRECADMVYEQPTIEPERKKGHWIKIHWKAFRCSECNKISEYSTYFCPNCGADMREGADG